MDLLPRIFARGREYSGIAPMKKTNPIFTAADWLVYLAVRLTVALIGIFPIDACQTFARFLAFLLTRLFGVRRMVLEENLLIAFPESTPGERNRLVRRMWEHLLMMGVEFFYGRRLIHETNWRHYVELVDGQKMVRLFFENRPIVMVTGHFGNFEMGGYLLGLLGYPTYSVARNLDNRFLNRYIHQLRETTGQYLVDKKGAAERVEELMERNEIVAFLSDQSAGPKGCWVDFFGRPASAYKAMALLSFQYNAPILVCHATRIDSTPMRIRLEPVDLFDPAETENGLGSVFEITQWFTSLLERSIRRSPEQYWWLHRRWKNYGKNISIDAIRAKIGQRENN